ncbi:hypothetical protein SLS64_005377 [Diaporthe eres]
MASKESAQGLFQQLLANASQPRGSTADACVKLCEKTSHDLFDFFIEWNEKDQHRSMRLVLDLVSFLVTQNPLPQVKEDVKADLLHTTTAVIARKSTRPLVKSCTTALGHLLTKSVLTLEDVAQMYQSMRPDLSEQPAIILWQEWVVDVFRWMELHYVCPAAGKLLGIVFSGLFGSFPSRGCLGERTPALDATTMRRWLETALAANPELLESIKNYFLAPLFKSDRALSIALLQELHQMQPQDEAHARSDELDTAALLHLAALELGKKASIVFEPREWYLGKPVIISIVNQSSDPGQTKATGTVELDGKVLERFLLHNSYDVRSFAMSLLITSSSITRPYSITAFFLLRKHLRSCHADPDAKFRNEILGHSKNMIKRVKGAISVLEKDLSRTETKASTSKVRETGVNTHISKGAKEITNAGKTWLRDTLDAHERFLSWYLQFLWQELAPTASYQRHITALKALVTVLKLGKEDPSAAEQSVYTDPRWIRIILDLIMDPFDDVRETATGLLMLFPLELGQKETLATQSWQSHEAQLQRLAASQARIVDLCVRIWNTVSYVLCDDSPEGKELESNEGLDTKDLLSYSFRAIHESSNLQRTIVALYFKTSGLMDSLFGTGDSKAAMEAGWDGKTLRISYTKYPSLPPILLNLLQSGQLAMEPGTLTSSSAAESVFPALDIIRRAGPPESHRNELYRLITRYLGSQQWHVREIAARTLCSFLLNENWLSSVRSLLEESRGSANRLHGTLLTVRFFLERTSMDRRQGQLLGQTIMPELDGHSQLAKFVDEIKALGQTLQEFEMDATICSEVWAAFVETRTLTQQIAPPANIQTSKAEQFANLKIAQGRNSFTSRALLDHRVGTSSLREAVALKDIDELKSCLLDALDGDTDTACMLLEAIPMIWGKSQTPELSKLYLEICEHTKVPEARAQGLTNLTGLLDDHIFQGKMKDLPAPEEFESFQRSTLDSINPALANAVLLASGPVVAIQIIPHIGQLSFFMFEQRLRAWGKAIADALDDSNTFDMRMAAAMAIRSFAAAVRSAAGNDAAYLPFLLALYNTLVDDDDEIRDVGASATAFITSPDPHVLSPQPLVAVDAADTLLSWLQERFGHTNEFRAYVACRLVGDPIIALDIGVQDLTAWASPEQQFAEALEVDESLFAVEEQNLFIDEVRETQRWADVFTGLPRDYDQTEGDDGVAGKVLIMDSSLDALKGWVEKALEVLAVQVGQDDGPLGWASMADAFALCHRVLVCGQVMADLLGEEGSVIASSLARIKDIGQRSRLHGLLLSSLDRV